MTPGAAGDQLDGRLFTCFTHHVRPYPRAASLPPPRVNTHPSPPPLCYIRPLRLPVARQTRLQAPIRLDRPPDLQCSSPSPCRHPPNAPPPLPPTLCSSRKPGTLQSTFRRQCVRASVASVASRGAGPSCLDFSFRPVILVQSHLVFTRSRHLTQHAGEA